MAPERVAEDALVTSPFDAEEQRRRQRILGEVEAGWRRVTQEIAMDASRIDDAFRIDQNGR